MENIYFEKYLKSYFIENGLDIDSLISCPVNDRDKTKLCYTCTCGNSVERTSRLFKTKPLCNNCIPKKKRGAKATTIESFKELLESKGYSLVDDNDPDYVNSKSLIEVVCQDGTTYKTSYNRFQSGHRSKAEANENLKVPLDEVIRRVKEAGFSWIEGTEYKGKSIPFPVICHCGLTFNVRLENIREKRVGCDKCYRYNRKYPWEYIVGVADEYGCTIISTNELYKGRETVVELFCACNEEIIKTVRCFLKAPRCSICSLHKREETNLQTIGRKNYFEGEVGKFLVEQYWFENFGVPHNMKLAEIYQKSRETCKKNYGVYCVLSTDEVRKKALKAHIDKWGAAPGFVKEIREKMKATNLKNLGCEYPFQSAEVQALIKSVILRDYGVTHIMHVPHIFEKAQKSAHALKCYTFPSGEIRMLQGYEWKCMDYLLAKGVDEVNIITGAKYVPKVNYIMPGESSERRYFMDAYYDIKDRGIEVKSTYTYTRHVIQDKQKWISASFVCEGGIDIYVFDAKKFCFRQRIKKGEITGIKINPDYLKECSVKNKKLPFDFPEDD
jgi:hypothetical protein